MSRAQSQSLPPDSEYVTVKNGHLHLQGERVRYWGIIGHFINDWNWRSAGPQVGDSPEVRGEKIEKRHRDIEKMADRIKAMGFNLYRCSYHPDELPFTKGDGSANDMMCHFLWELDKRGIKVWMSGIEGGEATQQDASIINDPKTEQAWKAAVGEYLAQKKVESAPTGIGMRPRMWDPRFRALIIRHRQRICDIRNPYKNNIRLGDDPQIVVWELCNEEWQFTNMLRGVWQEYPLFFQQELFQQWNDFLLRKYGSNEKLSKAWLALLPGESLKAKTVQLAPLKTEKNTFVTPNDVNPNVIALLRSGAKGTLSRDMFNRQRGADVIEFLLKIYIDFKEAEYAAMKKNGKSCRLSPLILDTGEGFNIQSLFLHQHGDASSVCTYMTGLHHDSTHRRFPWNSGLEEPPRLCWNVPWIESLRLPDKPFFVYEVNIHNPAKYRSEFPYRVAALASIQDFDILNWHVFGGIRDMDTENPFGGSLAYDMPHDPAPHGLHYDNDEVLQSAIQAAGEVFKSFALSPAPNPAQMVFGRNQLYNPATMDYGSAFGDLGARILPTVYRYGLRMSVDLSRETDTVIGPTLLRGCWEPNPLKPSPEIEFNWLRSYLKFDGPAAATYTGFLAEYPDKNGVSFDNGVRLTKVTFNNPKGIAYPVAENERYLSFSVVARDGKPLAKTRNAIISLVSTSFNSGFKLDHSKIHSEYRWQENPGCMPSVGNAPVLVTRVGATIGIQMLNGMKYAMLDWNFKKISEGEVKNGTIAIPNDKPVYVVTLTR